VKASSRQSGSDFDPSGGASDFDPSGGASDFDPSGGASDFDPSGVSPNGTEQYGPPSKWEFRPPHPIDRGAVITEMVL
jgi:hypothetical protein